MRKLYFLFFFLVVVLLSACSIQSSGYETIYKDDLAKFIQKEYPLFDVVASAESSSNYSEVYVAEGKALDQVALELQGVKQPLRISDKNNEKQVLVYNHLFVILSKDEDNTGNTLIELANKEFVRNNFNPGFFEGMLLMTFLDDVLDVDDWGKNRRIQCNSYPERCYGGFSSSGGSFKGYQNRPSVRGGTSTVRGGGPGAGK